MDGIVCYSEVGVEDYVEFGFFLIVKYVICVYDVICLIIKFEYGGKFVFSGGYDCIVKSWNVFNGVCIFIFWGCLGFVLDLFFFFDFNFVIVVCSDYKFYFWEIFIGWMWYILIGYMEKVVLVDVSKISNCCVVSVVYDCFMKIWDM